ncbi:phage tail terminator protein, partial [Serratia ficaria]|uniref:phage tail terminator protein n=1 Tax=Serratia ficaria TaxID=61651 RepID=UPI0021C7309D
MVTDYLFCEPLLIARLRESVSEFVDVTGVAGLAQMNDDNPMCPMAYVMYLGDTPPCQDSCRLELKNFRGPETTKMNTYSPERKAALIARM